MSTYSKAVILIKTFSIKAKLGLVVKKLPAIKLGHFTIKQKRDVHGQIHFNNFAAPALYDL